VDNSAKHELSKIQHEKKLLENKISQQTNEIDNLKKKSANQMVLQKENMTLKTQISKQNSQLNEAKNEVNKSKQQFLTHKAVLESKLENAKKSIKTLKDQKIPITNLNPPRITSPTKAVNKALNKPQLSNFSVSPFLSKSVKTTSPSKSVVKSHPLANVESSTPQQQIPSKNVLAHSTPGSGLKSPSKLLTARKPGSALKNLLSPPKKDANGQAQNSSKRKKASSLFDDDEAEDDDLFGDAVRKAKSSNLEKKTEWEGESIGDNSSEPINDKKLNVIKRKKKKIGSKAIVEVDEEDIANNHNAYSPLKRVKLLDKIGGISPLKQRNKEHNLFKV
jgi:hypothetical protein